MLAAVGATLLVCVAFAGAAPATTATSCPKTRPFKGTDRADRI